jgi:hypothetical protein
MTASPFSQLLADSIATAEPGQGLTDDELYGVFMLWCLLRGELPAASPSLLGRHARGRNPRPVQDRQSHPPGLRTTGPAAADYILASQSSLALFRAVFDVIEVIELIAW